MKKKKSLTSRLRITVLLLSLLMACLPAAADITINGTNFPDGNFRTYVKQFDTNNDGVLSTAEMNAVTSMYLYNLSLTSVKGIGNFANLKTLNCESNYLQELDLSQNTKLESLNCRSQHGCLTFITLPASIKDLNCSYNTGLTSLNLSSLANIQSLDCRNCGLTSLLVSPGATGLRTVYSQNNKLRGQQMAYFLNSLPMLVPYGYTGNLYLIDGDSENEENEMVDASWYTTMMARGWHAYGNLINNWYDYNTYVTLETDYVAINRRNFPDGNFRAFVKANCQNDGDNFLSHSEIAALKVVTASDRDIASLKGIELFPELTTLTCSQNLLTELDVSRNSKLTTLNCSNNGIEELQALPPTLQKLLCNNNALARLDLTQNTALTELNCSDNSISMLKVGTGVSLLRCANNQFSTISGLNSCSQLRLLDCSGNRFTSLKVSNFSQLSQLICHSNPLLSSLECENNGKLMRLQLPDMPSLTTLRCNNNSQLYSLTLTGDSELTSLYCNNNALASLNLDDCKKLQVVECSSNNIESLRAYSHGGINKVDCSYNPALTSLNVVHYSTIKKINMSHCTAIKTVDLSSINLEELSVVGCTSLEEVNVGGNELTTLNFSGCNSLRSVLCGSNNLTRLDVGGRASLTKLDCKSNNICDLNISGCSNLEELDCTYNQIETLDLSGFSRLEELGCGLNNLTQLDLSACTQLRSLVCSYNPLNSLDLSALQRLEILKCDNVGLSVLDLTGRTRLTTLSCNRNQLTALDLSPCTAIEYIDCCRNSITNITMPAICNQLTEFRLYANRLQGHAMNSIVAALPTIVRQEYYDGDDIYYDESVGRFVVYYDRSQGDGGTIVEHNICTTQHAGDAKAKNWLVLQVDYKNHYSNYDGVDMPTAIQPSLCDTQDDTPAPQYNLGGQRVNRTYKGIVVVNGKKVVRP